MNTYKIYRAIFADSIEDIDFENIGQSFAIDEGFAVDFAEGSIGATESYFIIEAVVNEDQINIAQTNAQWESEWANEGEVVLYTNEEINIIIEGHELVANTGFARDTNDDTRPAPIECDSSEITEHLYA